MTDTPLRPGLIELTVERPQLLFHTFDPSPVGDRELDDKLERFIVHWAEDEPAPDYRMVVYVRADDPSPAEAEELAAGVRAHFGHLSDVEARKRRLLLREGRSSLAVGLGFLLVCGAVGLFALRTLPAPVGYFVDQGLLIIGWVANWRPVEIFLYDWRPLLRNERLFRALAHMDITFAQVRPAAS
ncbi:MAG TPA: hypothetical protein VFS49_07695 [Croceibacterium sp.]|nr:hypothetical protein [Croceibacterium sp.]